jgi:hypothetical protein
MRLCSVLMYVRTTKDPQNSYVSFEVGNNIRSKLIKIEGFLGGTTNNASR